MLIDLTMDVSEKINARIHATIWPFMSCHLRLYISPLVSWLVAFLAMMPRFPQKPTSKIIVYSV